MSVTISTAGHAGATRVRRPRWALAAAVAALVLAVVSTLAATGNAAADGPDQVVSVPVEFKIKIQNRAVPCDTPPPASPDAVVRGTLTAPAKALAQGKVAGGLYSHGDGYDESFFNFPFDKRFNVVEDLAKRGHVSVTIDRLGYGESDKPNGNTICYGHEADVLSQIIGQLRQGSYQGEKKPGFSRVALFGHSASGFIVEQEAAIFGGIDALGAISTGVEAATPLVLQRAGEQQVRCTVPPDPDGYAPLEATDEQFRMDHIFNVEPKIADILTKNRTEDACAGTRNLVNILSTSATNAAGVKVPVLAMAGKNDMFFPNVAAHAATFTASPQVTVKSIPQTGHAIVFSRVADQVRNELAAFLKANRF